MRRHVPAAPSHSNGKSCDFFFSVWNSLLVQCYYHYNSHRIKTWKGYRLIAVDGSTLYLINKPEVVNYFGTQVNQHTQVPMARTLLAHDVLNGITLRSFIAPIKISERTLAEKWIADYPRDTITIYDRGFYGYKLMYLHLNQERQKVFVIRAREDSKIIKSFIRSGETDTLVTILPDENAMGQLYKSGYKITAFTSIRVRLIRVVLEDGTTEVLATNLYNTKKYPAPLFKSLYFKRWPIETNINLLKNTLQIENFSGQTVATIQQDFYASIFTANLHQLLVNDCQVQVRHKTRQRKHSYSINKNITIGILKSKLVKLFIEKRPVKIINELKLIFVNHLQPVRKGRKFKRRHKTKRLNGKYQTFNNYKRAL